MKVLLHTFAFLGVLSVASCFGSLPTLQFTADAEGLQLGGASAAPNIRLDKDDSPAAILAAKNVAVDFGRVLGINGSVWLTGDAAAPKGPTIIAGTIGKSKLIDDLIAAGKIDVSEVKGKWESYTTTLVDAPIAGVDRALVIAGSDRRGTVYALYDISEQIGVSPWYWWADVPTKHKTEIYAKKVTKVQGPPSVKYRGIFLNDEQPALTNWVKEKYGNYNSNFHGKVFELLLRLKANYFWPAMWDGMFYVDDNKNGPLADQYGIVMGTSHTEPLARSTKEQSTYMSGEWDWASNSNNVKKFMQEGATRAKNWETMWTAGMRGVHDTGSATLTPKLLEDVIAFQQQTLKTTLGQSDLTKIPHMWCLYKEVGGLYEAGMKVPDEVTLLWNDDNSGNLERLPIAKEQGRSGGAGVYYHFDYVGSPRNYKWINTIQLAKTWEQMQHAYARNARNIWIVNVGDLKPLELPISHFIDMAYDITKFTEADNTDKWLAWWAEKQWGSAVAEKTAYVMATYGQLIARRKYELLTTEPFAFSTQNYDEAENTLNDWTALVDVAQKLHDSLDAETQISFFEIVLHPVLAGKTVYEVYLKAAINLYYSKQKRSSTNTLAAGVKAAYAADGQITQRYHKLLGGKWNHMMDQVHLGYNNWQDPSSNSMPKVTEVQVNANPANGLLGVSVQGSTNSAPGDAVPAMLAISNYQPPKEPRYIDVYARGNGNIKYEIKPKAAYVTLTPSAGTLTFPGINSDHRAVISVDWAAAPAGLTNVPIEIFRDGTLATTLSLPVRKEEVPAGFKGFVESNGAVTMEADHFSSQVPVGDVKYAVVPNYGRTHAGVILQPFTAPTQTVPAGPKLVYDFFAFTEKADAKITIYLGASLNFDPTRPNKLAFAIDSDAPKTVQPVPATKLGSPPSGWDQSTQDNSWKTTQTLSIKKGARKLNLWALEPGVVFTKIVIDLGGVKSSYLGPPESARIE